MCQNSKDLKNRDVKGLANLRTDFENSSDKKMAILSIKGFWAPEWKIAVVFRLLNIGFSRAEFSEQVIYPMKLRFILRTGVYFVREYVPVSAVFQSLSVLCKYFWTVSSSWVSLECLCKLNLLVYPESEFVISLPILESF